MTECNFFFSLPLHHSYWNQCFCSIIWHGIHSSMYVPYGLHYLMRFHCVRLNKKVTVLWEHWEYNVLVWRGERNRKWSVYTCLLWGEPSVAYWFCVYWVCGYTKWVYLCVSSWWPHYWGLIGAARKECEGKLNSVWDGRRGKEREQGSEWMTVKWG